MSLLHGSGHGRPGTRISLVMALLAIAFWVGSPQAAPLVAQTSTTGFDTVPATVLGDGVAVQASVAADGIGGMYAVYRDDVLGVNGIFLRVSTDSGKTWMAPQPLMPFDANYYAPSIAVRRVVGSAYTQVWVSALRFTCPPGGPICGYQPEIIGFDSTGRVLERKRLPYVVYYEPAVLEASDQGVLWGFRRFDADSSAVAVLLAPSTVDGDAEIPYSASRTFKNVYRIDAGASDEMLAFAVLHDDRSVEVVSDAAILAGSSSTQFQMEEEWFHGVEVTRTEAHVLTTKSLAQTVSEVPGRLDPANQVAEVRVRTAGLTGALVGGFGAPKPLGMTPLFYSPAMAAGNRELAVAWEDAATRSLVTAIVWGRGAVVGEPSPVPGSLAANSFTLEATTRPPSTDPVARFGWSVADTYIDVDGDGFFDPRITPLAASPELTVTLDGCASSASTTDPLAAIAEYRWTIDGVAVEGVTGCRFVRRLAADQDHAVSLAVVRLGDGAISTSEQQVTPRNLVVVSLGDGVASGEGNPEVPSTFDPSLDATALVDANLHAAEWQDRACHRSALAGPAVAAQRLEQSDRHSAVTFIHLACSGASIMSGDPVDPAGENRAETGGLLDPYQGVEPTSPTTDESQARPSQLDQLAALVSGNEVDSLLLSVGGADVALDDVIEDCVLSGVEIAGADMGCDRIATKTDFDRRMAALPDRFTLLADALGGRFPELAAQPGRILVTEYADPTKDERGLANLRCVADSETAGKVAKVIADITGALTKFSTLTPATKAFLGALNKSAKLAAELLGGGNGLITDTEARWLSTSVYAGVNGLVRDAANGYGWRFVGGISERFGRSGYCADDGARRVVQVLESLWQQTDLHGAFQPNGGGQTVYADALARELLSLFPIDGIVPGGPGDAGSLTGEVGDFVLAFQAAADPVTGDRPQLIAADLAVRGATLETTAARRIDAAVAPPAVTAGTWGDYRGVAADGRSAVVAWSQAYAADQGGISGLLYRALVGRAFVGRPDIAVESVGLVQAPDEPVRLAEGKATVVRARLDATLAEPTDVAVHVLVTGKDADIYEATHTVRLVDGVNDVILPSSGVLPLPEAGDSWGVRIEVTDPGDAAADVGDGSNDWKAADAITVAPTRSLRVLFAPVAGTGVTCAQTSALARRAVPYSRAALPVTEGGVSAAFGGTTLVGPGGCPALPPAPQSDAGTTAALQRLDRLARLAGVDVIAGVVPESWLANAVADSDPWGMALLGAPGNPMRGTLLERQTYDNVFTHEVTHLLGFDHTLIEETTGLWVSRRAARKGPDYLRKGATTTRWASASTFDNALGALGGSAPPVPDGTGPAIRISGTVGLDGPSPAVTLDPWVAAAAADPPIVSDLQAQQVDADGKVLATDPIHLAAADADYPGPGPDPEPAPTQFAFGHAVALDPATAAIRLLLDGVEVATRPVSATAPTVTITSPTTGQVVPIGDPLTVTWTADDPDPGSVVTHSVLVSGDGGTTWQPLAVDLTDTTFTFDVPAGVSGDQVVVRVVSSDGVRSGVGVSAPFTVRTVERGPEQVAYVELSLATTCVTWQGCDAGIHTMAPDGTDDREILTKVVGDSVGRNRFVPVQPDWSPDGRTLAFSADAFYENPGLPSNLLYVVRSDIWLSDPEGGGRVRITRPVQSPAFDIATVVVPLQYTCPDWSPDGSRIAALAAREEGVGGADYVAAYVVTMAPDGSDLRFHGRLPTLPSGNQCPRWSPDGSRIGVPYSYAFGTEAARLPVRPGGEPWVFSGDPATNNRHVVTTFPVAVESTTSPGVVMATIPDVTDQRIEGGSWSADDAMIVAVGRATDVCGLVRVTAGIPGGEWVMDCPDPLKSNAAGTSQLRIQGFSPTNPQLAPDGRIAFASGWYQAGSEYDFVATLCTVPGDSTSAVPTFGAPNFPGLSCVTGPGTTGELPLTGALLGKVQIDWSAGPVLDDGGGGEPPPDLLLPLADADAGGPYTVDEDTDVTLDASGSALLGPGASFEWDLDGDGEFDDAIGMQPTVRFADSGPKPITVRVSVGATTATADAAVDVLAVAPDIAEPGRQQALLGVPTQLGPFSFSDEGEAGHEAWIDLDGVRYPGVVDGRTFTVVVTVNRPGPLDGTLEVCDAGGGPCRTASLVVDVDERPVVTGVGPAEVQAVGGNGVIVRGRHLQGTTEVLVGGVAVSTAEFDGLLTFVAPPGQVGSSVRVAVPGADGEGLLTYVDRRAVDQRLFTSVDTPLVVELAAFDAETNTEVPAANEIVSTPSNGRLDTDVGAGTDLAALPPVPAAIDREVVYRPNDGFVGTDQFQVRVVGDDRIATVTIKVGNVAPVAGADTVSVPVGAVSTLDLGTLLANDSDPDAADWSTEPATARASALTDEPELTVAAAFGGPSMPGAVWLDADGILRFAAPPDATGSTEFTYVVADAQGALGEGTVTVQFAVDRSSTTTTITTSTPATVPEAPAPTVPSTTVAPVRSDVFPPPPDTPPTTQPPLSGTLPATGSSPWQAVRVALMLAGAGVFLTAAAWRGRRSSQSAG